MEWIKFIIGALTEPPLLFKYSDGTYWIECSEKEYQKYNDRENIILYNMVYQNSIGIWRKSPNRVLFAGSNRFNDAKKYLKLENWEPYP